MATRNSATIIDAKLAASYYAAPKPKQKQALAAFRRALQESQPPKRKDPRLAQGETALLLRVNHNLTPAEQARYAELTAQPLEGKLTKQGDAELGAQCGYSIRAAKYGRNISNGIDLLQKCFQRQ